MLGKEIKAKEFLIEKARNKVVTYYSEVWKAIGSSRWEIGRVLLEVAKDCHDKNEPILTSLVEYKKGGIGEGYENVVEMYGADKYKVEQKKCFDHDWRDA